MDTSERTVSLQGEVNTSRGKAVEKETTEKAKEARAVGETDGRCRGSVKERRLQEELRFRWTHG